MLEQSSASLHSVAVCVPTHCYAVCWFMPTASGLPRPHPPPSPCMKWLLVSFKQNCRSGRIFSVTRQCLNGDSVRHPMIQNIGLYAYQYNLNEVWQKTSYWNQNVVEMLLIPTKYWTVTCNLTVTSPQGNLATGNLAIDLVTSPQKAE